MKTEETKQMLERYARLLKNEKTIDEVLRYAEAYVKNPRNFFEGLPKTDFYNSLYEFALESVYNHAVEKLGTIRKEKEEIEMAFSSNQTEAAQQTEPDAEKEKIVRVRSKWAMIFEKMSDMCTVYGWTPGGNISRAANEGKRINGRYVITKIPL